MASELVFITGGTGYIGSHVALVTLKAGYQVRLSIRRESQAAKMKEVLQEFSDKLQFVVIPDITAADAFNDALKGVSFVFHLASPMPYKGSDLKDYVDPAVNGTIGLLQASVNFPRIQRIVITSSFASLMPLGGLQDGKLLVKEGLASDIHVDVDMEIPENSEGDLAKYQISKILAHQESLAFIRDHDVNYSLITFHPSFVLGHSLIQSSVEDIDAMNGLLLQSIQSKTPLIPPIIVNVTDVAEAHLRALDPSLSTGTEFLLTGAPATWHDIVDYVKAHFKQYDIQVASPFPEYPTLDASRATKLLGMKWKPLNETIRSVLSQQLSFKGKK